MLGQRVLLGGFTKGYSVQGVMKLYFIMNFFLCVCLSTKSNKHVDILVVKLKFKFVVNIGLLLTIFMCISFMYYFLVKHVGLVMCNTGVNKHVFMIYLFITTLSTCYLLLI